MSESSFRYFKVGVALVKVEYNRYGARAAYVWEDNAFKIDNRYIAEIMEGDEVEELNEAEFLKQISESH